MPRVRSTKESQIKLFLDDKGIVKPSVFRSVSGSWRFFASAESGIMHKPFQMGDSMKKFRKNSVKIR